MKRIYEEDVFCIGGEWPKQEQYKDEGGEFAARLEARLSSPIEESIELGRDSACVKYLLILLDGVYERCRVGQQADRWAGDETSALTSTLKYEPLFAIAAAPFVTFVIAEIDAKHQGSLSVHSETYMYSKSSRESWREMVAQQSRGSAEMRAQATREGFAYGSGEVVFG